LKFEGEYKNEEKNGEGKEYYCNGNAKFEGVYINDERHGIGKEYYCNGNVNLKENMKMEKGME